MKVKTKLLIGFIAVSMTTAIVGVIGWFGLSQTMGSIGRLGKESIPSIINLEVIKIEQLNIRYAVRVMMDTGTTRDDYSQMMSMVAASRNNYNKSLSEYDSIAKTKQEDKLFKTFQTALEETKTANNSYFEFMKDVYDNLSLRESQENQIDSEGTKALASFDNSLKTLQDLIDYAKDYYGTELVNQSLTGATAMISIMLIALVISIIAAFIMAAFFGNLLTSPLTNMEKGLTAMSKGDLNNKMIVKTRDEFGKISESYNIVAESLKSMVSDAEMLAVAAVEGRLTTRADSTRHQGDFKKIVDGVNKTLDSVIGPLNVTAKYVDDISKGIIPPIITDNYNGDFNLIKNNLNSVVKMMNDLLKETDGIIKAAADGELDKRANADIFLGGWNKLVAGVNDTITNIVNPLMVTADYVDKISKGIIPPEITTVYKGQYNIIKVNLNAVVKMMSDLLKETDGIIKAAADGELDKRANAEMFLGGWNKLVAGVNDTISNIVNPLMVTADYVDNISKGSIPQKITDIYKGDYNIIKNNLNTCIDAVNQLVADAGTLAQAGVEGKLDTRADAAKHQGDFKKIVDGVNSTLDSVIKPINETIAILQKLAVGDLTTEMKGDYKGDFEVLKNALNASLGSINEILVQVNSAVDQVASGAAQVSQASQSLSQGASEQASSLEEITSSITEMNSQTKQNTENAVTVNGLAKTAKENAEQGNTQMSDLVKAMSSINVSAESIKKIVKAIDDIAFQINLLALNANVEAARAGKYGKGFAVVAEEVRNLAVRSATSVKETNQMVEEAIKNIENGNSLVTVTSKQLAEIVEGASKVADLAEEVATASKEQSQGLEQISTGLGQIDEVTQSNTANAEESASASEELASQAQQLKAMIAKFKLKMAQGKIGDLTPEMMQMIRNELTRGQSQHQSLEHLAQTASHEIKHVEKPVKAAKTASPKHVIALDDDNFGKF